MSFDGLLVHTVQILTAGTTQDRYGNDQKDWPTATSQTAKAWIAQRSSDENRDGREAEIGNWVAFLAPDVTITGRDRIVWGDLTFDLVGPPLPAWTPRGLHHYEATMRAVDG